MEGLAAQRGAHLRFRGQWLERAGFHPGMTITATVVSPSVMELRVNGPAQFTSADFQNAIQPFTRLGI